MRFPASARRTISVALAALASIWLLPPGYAAPLAFATEVLADLPFGYWRLNETAPAFPAADASGTGNNGTYSPAPPNGLTLNIPGLQGGDTGVQFAGLTATDGTTGRVLVPKSATLEPAQITMEAKVRWDGSVVQGDYQRIVERSYYGPTYRADGSVDFDHSQEQAQYGFGVYLGHIHAEFRTGAGSGGACGANVACADSSATVQMGVETHVVVTYDGKQISIYINGVLDIAVLPVNQGTIEPYPATNNWGPPWDSLGIGNQSARDRQFKGLIDEVALYDHVLSSDRVLAHYRSQFVQARGFEYAVKFVCGQPGVAGPGAGVVAPGQYFTAINVHNPGADLEFRDKVAVALPSETAGPISPFFPAHLKSDQAFEIDCPDILRKARTRGFLKGFVVLQSPAPLDVVAVYTAAGATGRVETMEIERVPARPHDVVEALPDLVPSARCLPTAPGLTVTVQNLGSATALAPFQTEVSFGAFGSALHTTTTSIPPGGADTFTTPIPPACFHPDCAYSVTADKSNVVVESNEANNSISAICRG